MSVKPIASTSFSPAALIPWHNGPVLQAYGDLNQLTRNSTQAFFFAEPVLRWEQTDTSGQTIPNLITWYGPECYNAAPNHFRPLPEWGAQLSTLTEQLAQELKKLIAAATSDMSRALLETALRIPSLQAVLTNGQGQFILYPWGSIEQGVPVPPYEQTPLGLLTGKITVGPSSNPSSSPEAAKGTTVHMPQRSAAAVLPVRLLPRWLVVCLNILVGLVFFMLAFWAGTLFLLRWTAGVSLSQPFSLTGLMALLHFWPAMLQATPPTPDALHALIGGMTP